MAVSVALQQKAEQSTSSVSSFTTTAMTVTAGNAIVACMCVSNLGASLAASDSKVNGYSQAVFQNAQFQTVAISVATNILGGSTTYTVTPGTAGFCSMCATEHSGMATAPTDTATNKATGAGQAVSPGAVNPAGSGDLYVSCWSHNGSGNESFTAGGGFALRSNLTNTTNEPLGSEDLVATGSQTGSATLGGAAGPSWSSAAATFRAALPPIGHPVTQLNVYRM